MRANVMRVLLPLLLLFAFQQLGSATVIHAKAWLAPKLIARAWNHSQGMAGEYVKPWPWADTWPVARLQVASQQIDQYVLGSDGGNALAFSPGHAGASAPLGSPGRAVISGHRDTHFSFLEHLGKGELLSLELASGEVRRYRVQYTVVVDASRTSLSGSVDANELLLVTCYPFDAINPAGPMRYVVVAKPEPLQHRPSQSRPPATGGYIL